MTRPAGIKNKSKKKRVSPMKGKTLGKRKKPKIWQPSPMQYRYIKITIENMATNTTTSRIEQAKLLGINHNTLTNWHKNKNFQKWFEKQLNENMFKTLSKTAKEGLLKIAQGKGGWVEEKEAYVAGKKTGDKEVKRITTPTRDQVKAQETILKLTGELTEKVDVKSVNVNVDMDAEAFLRSQVIKQEQRPKKLEDV